MDEQGSGADRLRERELEQLREREASYRDRLAASAARIARLRHHTAALMDILRRRPTPQGDVMLALGAVAQVSMQALAVERTSLWSFEEQPQRLTCKLLLTHEGESVPTLESLSITDSPEYLRALRTADVVAVQDVHDDPRTAGLMTYLNASQVSAFLNISVAAPGVLLGVVCHEAIGGARVWHPEEIDFASHVSNLLALAVESDRRQAAEAKVLRTEARYKYLVESLPVTVYSFDAHFQRLEYLSPRVQDIGGLDAQRMLAGGVPAWLDLVVPEDRPRVAARFSPEGPAPEPAEIQYRVQLPVGLRYVRDQCRVVRDHAGNPIAVQGVLADVTEQRRNEERSRELARRLQTLLENVDMIAIVLDGKGTIEFVNGAFERATGFLASEAVGRNAFELLLSEPEAQSLQERFLAELTAGVVPTHFENEISGRGGRVRRVLWTNGVLYSEEGAPAGCCSLGLDVTERTKLDAALLEQAKLESLGQLAAGVAHDFNNLLMVMSLNVAQLARTRHDPRDAQAIEMLEQSLQQATLLTRSLMIYARRHVVHPQPVELDPLIEETLPLLTALTTFGPELSRSLHAPGARVFIDPAQLRQLLMNLVGNAMDATRGQGRNVRIITGVEFLDAELVRSQGGQQAGRYVKLSVADDGRGMDARTLARAGEPYFTTKQPGNGTGLGLAVCRAIALRAGGFMRLESSPAQGTTSLVYLPLVAEPGSEAVPRTKADAAEPRALVVEDEPALRALIASVLAEHALDVLVAGSASDAAQLAAGEPIDLLIVDSSLPDGSGRVLARSLRLARPALRVILVSSAAAVEDEFDATLRKPLDETGLRMAIADVLGTTTG